MLCPSCKNQKMKRETYKYNNVKSLVILKCSKCGVRIDYEVRTSCFNS